MPDDAKDGFDITIETIKGLADDATLEDLAKIGDVSEEDQKKIDALDDYIAKECPDLGRGALRARRASRRAQGLDDLRRLAGLAHQGAAGRLPVEQAAVEVDRVAALLDQVAGHARGAARRPCRPRGSARPAPRRAGSAPRPAGCARSPRRVRAPTRRARGRRARRAPRAAGRDAADRDGRDAVHQVGPHLSSLLIRRSASGLPPVWQVGQYCRLESANETSRTVSPQTGQGFPVCGRARRGWTSSRP